MNVTSRRVATNIALGAAIAMLAAFAIGWSASSEPSAVSLAVKDGKHLFAVVRFNGRVGSASGPWLAAPDGEGACERVQASIQNSTDQRLRAGTFPPLFGRVFKVGEIVSSCEWSVEAPAVSFNFSKNANVEP